MSVEWYILGIIAIASLSLGFLVGFILRSFFRGKGSQGERAKGRDAKSPPVKKKATNRHLLEVAKLWRDRRDRKLVFQVGTEFYKLGSDLANKDKELLLKVVMDFYHWLEPEGKKQTPVAETLQSLQPPPPLSTVVQVANQDTSKIDFNPVNVLSQALQSDVGQYSLPSQSVVSQVDAILQEKLDVAGMKKWAIRLTELPQKGMVVMVGLEQYDGINEVPYEQVRTIIRESVSEWEQRAEAGKITK